jgi:hypothetical protein
MIAARAAKPDGVLPASSLVILVIFLLLGALLGWLKMPSSSSPVAGAYIDKDKGFSLVAPLDWIPVNPANQKAFATEYKSHFPAHLQQFLAAPGFAVGFFKIQDKEGTCRPR